MAIARPGPLVGAISGPVGGVSFSTGRGSLVVSKRTHKIARTSRQALKQRGRIIDFADKWAQLDDADRALWTEAARNTPVKNRLGQARTLPPFQAFVSSNAVNLGSSVLAEQPNIDFGPPDPITITSLDFDPAAYAISYTSTPTGSVIIGNIFGWPYLKTRPRTSPPQWRFITTRNFFSASNTEQIRSEWLDVFGPLSVDEALSVGIRLYRVGGLPGQLLVESTTVVP